MNCGQCDFLKFQYGAEPSENWSICKKDNDVSKRPDSESCLFIKENKNLIKIGYMKIRGIASA